MAALLGFIPVTPPRSSWVGVPRSSWDRRAPRSSWVGVPRSSWAGVPRSSWDRRAPRSSWVGVPRSSWDRSMNTVSGAPWLMLPPTSEGGASDTVYNFYSLSDRKVVSFNVGNDDAESVVSADGWRVPVGSSHGWLVVFNKTNGNLFLTDPLSGRHINLPSIHTLISEEYFDSEGSEEYLSDSEAYWKRVQKAIISTSPDDDGCLAMLTFGPTDSLAFCLPGRSTKWTPIGGNCQFRYHDFVYSSREETFFCITELGELEAWDLRNPQSPQMIMSYDFMPGEESSSLLKERCMWQYYLVVGDGGEILLVRQYIFSTNLIEQSGLLHDCSIDDVLFRSDGSFDLKSLEDAIRLSDKKPICSCSGKLCPHKTVGFDVYKYESKERRVRYLESSLDGQALFIGLNHSSAMDAHKLKLKPDSIYFTDIMEQTPNSDDGGHDIGIFNYQDSTFSSCYYPYDFRSIKKITPSPIWFFPNPTSFI